MCLIVALFFSFLIEVCWLLYCVVYSLCKITQLEKQDNQKCIFATDRILEQNSVRRTFKCVATVTCLIMAVPYWCFCGVQWLFIHVIYIKCLGFWLERKDSREKKFRPSQWWPILDLAQMYTCATTENARKMAFSLFENRGKLGESQLRDKKFSRKRPLAHFKFNPAYKVLLDKILLRR